MDTDLDLSTLEASDELKAKFLELHNENVDRLKANTQSALTEKKQAQATALEQTTQLEEARKVAQDAKAKELEAQGKYEEAQTLREEERARLVAEANAQAEKATAALDKYHSGTVVNEIIASVIPTQQMFVKPLLESMTKVTYNEAGEPVISITDGSNVYTNAAEFLNGVKDSDSWKAVLLGSNSSGANTQKSNASDLSGLKWSEMDTEQKRQHLKNNPPQRK